MMSKTTAASAALPTPHASRTAPDSLAARIRRRRRASFGYCAALLGVYWAFVYVVTAKVSALSGLVADGLSVALMLGIVLIVGCLASTLLYVVSMSRAERAEAGARNEEGAR